MKVVALITGQIFPPVTLCWLAGTRLSRLSQPEL
jgi:hypothetical protein